MSQENKKEKQVLKVFFLFCRFSKLCGRKNKCRCGSGSEGKARPRQRRALEHNLARQMMYLQDNISQLTQSTHRHASTVNSSSLRKRAHGVHFLAQALDSTMRKVKQNCQSHLLPNRLGQTIANLFMATTKAVVVVACSARCLIPWRCQTRKLRA